MPAGCLETQFCLLPSGGPVFFPATVIFCHFIQEDSPADAPIGNIVIVLLVLLVHCCAVTRHGINAKPSETAQVKQHWWFYIYREPNPAGTMAALLLLTGLLSVLSSV